MSTSDCPNSLYLSFSQTNDIEILFNVYVNFIEMLKARNYVIDDEDNHSSDFGEFKTLFNNINDPDISVLQFIVEKGEQKEKVAIFWSDVEKIGMKQIKSYIDFMDDNEIDHIIILLKNQVTSFGKKAIEEFNINFPSKYIEFFEYIDLLINITKHSLTPKHTVLSEIEKDELVKKYNLKKSSQLPKLHTFDPIARYYGLKKGQIVKVLRQSSANTYYVNYRIVV